MDKDKFESLEKTIANLSERINKLESHEDRLNSLDMVIRAAVDADSVEHRALRCMIEKLKQINPIDSPDAQSEPEPVSPTDEEVELMATRYDRSDVAWTSRKWDYLAGAMAVRDAQD